MCIEEMCDILIYIYIQIAGAEFNLRNDLGATPTGRKDSLYALKISCTFNVAKISSEYEICGFCTTPRGIIWKLF